MPYHDGASEFWCLIDGPSHKQPCTGAYLPIHGAGNTVQLLHPSHTDEGRNTPAAAAPGCSCSADADDFQSVLVCWHCAPLEGHLAATTKNVTWRTGDAAKEEEVHLQNDFVEGDFWGVVEELTEEDRDTPTPIDGKGGSSYGAQTPPIERKPKRGRTGSPENLLEHDGCQTWNGGGHEHLFASLRKSKAPTNCLKNAPTDYGRASFARNDATTTNTADLLFYTNFPGACGEEFATLTPQQ